MRQEKLGQTHMADWHVYLVCKVQKQLRGDERRVKNTNGFVNLEFNSQIAFNTKEPVRSRDR